jgi:periplasmic copper chaperone A
MALPSIRYRRILMRRNLSALSAVLAFLLFAPPALAQGAGVEVKNAWARATPAGAQTGAAYVTLQSSAGDRLTAASTPAAQAAQLHTMSMQGGVMKMRQVDGIDLPAGQSVTLKPGGYHIMLMGLAQPLKAGQSFPLTLTFAKAGSQTVNVTVQNVGAMGPGGKGGMEMPGMDMHHH